MSRRARHVGLVALSVCSTCTGLHLARLEPHPSHAAALAVGAAICLFAAVRATVAFLTRSRRP